jgi:hypothetical protein
MLAKSIYILVGVLIIVFVGINILKNPKGSGFNTAMPWLNERPYSNFIAWSLIGGGGLVGALTIVHMVADPNG